MPEPDGSERQVRLGPHLDVAARRARHHAVDGPRRLVGVRLPLAKQLHLFLRLARRQLAAAHLQDKETRIHT